MLRPLCRKARGLVDVQRAALVSLRHHVHLWQSGGRGGMAGVGAGDVAELELGGSGNAMLGRAWPATPGNSRTRRGGSHAGGGGSPVPSPQRQRLPQLTSPPPRKKRMCAPDDGSHAHLPLVLENMGIRQMPRLVQGQAQVLPAGAAVPALRHANVACRGSTHDGRLSGEHARRSALRGAQRIGRSPATACRPGARPCQGSRRLGTLWALGPAAGPSKSSRAPCMSGLLFVSKNRYQTPAASSTQRKGSATASTKRKRRPWHRRVWRHLSRNSRGGPRPGA